MIEFVKQILIILGIGIGLIIGLSILILGFWTLVDWIGKDGI